MSVLDNQNVLKRIDNILSSCTKNNPSYDITGVLLYSDTKFIQMVEGEYNILMELYDKIKLDKRHKNVMMISCGPIKKKAFPSWHMGTRKISEKDVDFRTNINREDKDVFQKILAGNEEKGARVLQLLKKFF